MLEAIVIFQCLFMAFLLGVLSRILQHAEWHQMDYVVFAAWCLSFFPAAFTHRKISAWVGVSDSADALVTMFLLVAALSYCALRLGTIATECALRRDLIHKLTTN